MGISISNNGSGISPTAEQNYQDIGNTRIQWGTFVDTTTGSDTVSFPMPFLNTDYSFTATAVRDASNQISRTIGTGNKTTTSIDVQVYFPANTSTIATDIFWIAIGQKP